MQMYGFCDSDVQLLTEGYARVFKSIIIGSHL